MKNEKFYNLHADICKTIANPRRQAIIDTIRDREMTVSEIIRITGISQANLSQHLAILRSKGVLKSRREGNNIFYSVSDFRIIEAYDLISRVLCDYISSRDRTIKEAINRK